MFLFTFEILCSSSLNLYGRPRCTFHFDVQKLNLLFVRMDDHDFILLSFQLSLQEWILCLLWIDPVA